MALCPKWMANYSNSNNISDNDDNIGSGHQAGPKPLIMIHGNKAKTVWNLWKIF